MIVDAALRTPSTLRPADTEFLRDLRTDLAQKLSRLDYTIAPGVIHGDAHVMNLLPSHRGVLLSDFEAVSIGPREWDLTIVAVGRDRFGVPVDSYEEYAAAYGVDITAWDGYPTLRRVRELLMTAWVMQNSTTDEAIAEEAAVRVRTLREGDDERRWRIF